MHTNSLADASFNYQRRWATARRVVPRPLRRALRASYFLLLDGADLCLGKTRELVPPRWLNPTGDGDFENTGEEFLGYFVRLGGLRPEHNVLDIGCGIGRMARPLTSYLTSGSYEGFDIVPSGVRWCQKKFTPRFPNFRFTLADIRNREYNTNGTVTAAQYCFPYPDSRFNFVLLTSVFTHMMPLEVSHYLAEIHRVLATGGKCLATFFLLNQHARDLIAAGSSSLNFLHSLPGCRTTNPKIPETAIAFEEATLTDLMRANGLRIESTHYGRWCGRTEYMSYQDVVLLSAC